MAKENIPGYDMDTHSDKIGVVLTTREYVQVPYLAIDRLNEKENRSWIYHSPLYYEGSWIYIWKNGKGCKDKVLVKIPFGSVLILREDVCHRVLIGGVGNVRLHGTIIANEHLLSTTLLKYGSRNLKRAFTGTKVDYSTSVDLLNEIKTDAIKDIIPFMKEKLVFDNNYYSVMQNY